MILREARQRGVRRIIITHPNLGPMYTSPSLDELRQAVALGGYVEIVAGRLRRASRADAIATIRAIGPEHCSISTDSGLVGTPNTADALVMAARELRANGFTERPRPHVPAQSGRGFGLAAINLPHRIMLTPFRCAKRVAFRRRVFRALPLGCSGGSMPITQDMVRALTADLTIGRCGKCRMIHGRRWKRRGRRKPSERARDAEIHARQRPPRRARG